ncbi:nicotine blue oxidoreductase [Parafrankia irregularis]|uniref:Nicotine blue oxidoreductase n=1 Tax=Parafrankia irregularis TaxID=795642 RepID=A0A0S4QHM8_9ACTN|nr:MULTISPECIES: NTP transferase domain-containing protein [Parafrankia]MBE3203206.1 NTP transferase domain-containing protein [Parafrankia sp. CH37]CUU54150.1 nicotine blue oxidoreductase [Parafrankia irregularis]
MADHDADLPAQPRTTHLVAAVLAAGSGSRMGTPKATITVGGVRLLDRAINAAGEAGCDRIIAVVRSGTTAPNAELVVNPAPEQGLRSSLALALEQADTPGRPPADAVAVLLVDTPGIGGPAVRAALAAWKPGRVTVARYGQRRGHPIVMAPDLWRAAIALAGPDEGARRFLAAHPELLDEVPAPGDPTDLDTPDDLRRWTSS